MRASLRVALLGVLFVASPAAAVITNVDSADDICPPTADPCVIDQEVQVADGAVLDFGSRTVRIVGPNGQLNTGSGVVSVYAGEFIADAPGSLGINARGRNGNGGLDGGIIEIEARRRCTLDPERTCTGDYQCQAGTCSQRRCSADASRICTSDQDCVLGTCNAVGRCTNAFGVRCSTNADCLKGTCSVSVCSGNRGIECQTDADCFFGTCGLGSGLVDLNTTIRAGGTNPGAVSVRGAGEVTVRGRIDVSSTSADSDGGSVEIDSGDSSLIVLGPIDALGGRLAGGGDVSLSGALDVRVMAQVSVQGGDFDGGSLTVSAGRDVVFAADALADSIGGAGFGGEHLVDAGRDVIVQDGVVVSASGHFSSADFFGGDGGTIEMTAGRNIELRTGSKVDAAGARPDGFGGDITLDADNDVVLEGTIGVSPAGSQGAGGSIDVTAGRSVRAGLAAQVDARGGGGGGADVSVAAGRHVVWSAAIDASGPNGGGSAAISFSAGGRIALGGSMLVKGSGDGVGAGVLDVEGCEVTVAGTAVLDNRASNGKNSLRAHEGMTIASGAQVLASGSGGSNELVYRDGGPVPVVEGTVTPAPAMIGDPGLVPCGVCGDGSIDPGETCDDGNTVGGDGCSEECQDEGCIADTPDWPAVPLCDDGRICSVGMCDTAAGHCTYADQCDDGNPCTDDTCTADGCVHTDNTSPCDDGLNCTTGDTCSGGVCAGTPTCGPGMVCDPMSDQCVTTTTTSTTTTTTTTTTPGSGQCGDGVLDPGEECDDGDAQWLPGQYCSATCGLVACGDPDDSGKTTASDALLALRAAVRLASCDACICDTDGDGKIAASDALRLLRKGVGVNVVLACPACS